MYEVVLGAAVLYCPCKCSHRNTMAVTFVISWFMRRMTPIVSSQLFCLSACLNNHCYTACLRMSAAYRSSMWPSILSALSWHGRLYTLKKKVVLFTNFEVVSTRLNIYYLCSNCHVSNFTTMSLTTYSYYLQGSNNTKLKYFTTMRSSNKKWETIWY